MNIKKIGKYALAAVKISAAQLYVATFGRGLLKKNLWIIGEKETEARDNGYHFFRYLRREHPEINAYYVIRRGSADAERVRQVGPVIDFNSFKHCVYYSAAKVRACSQNHGVLPYENLAGIRRLRFFMRKDQRFVNLKHGISKDFRPGSFDFRKVGYDLYIAGAKPEYDAIRAQFNYPDKNIALTGFCRFDALHHLPKPEKMILVMPTFRAWLKTSDSSKQEASREEMEAFKKTRYYETYRSLLTNERFLNAARQAGYKIYFYLHYTFQPYLSAFTPLGNDVLTICGRGAYDVQDLLIRSAMLLTDYSSVFFDYGYMMKPMVFYQFDLKEYRDKHYKEGYFSYERDAFGPLVSTEDEVVDYTLRLLAGGMKMEDEYVRRVERFFIPRDDHNCQRVFEAIGRLEQP